MDGRGQHWSETAAGTDAGATATHAALSGHTHVVTSISGHTDGDTLIQILAGAAGATVVWESKIDVSVEGFSFNFPGLNVMGTTSIAVAGKIDDATAADCQVNISGYTI